MTDFRIDVFGGLRTSVDRIASPPLLSRPSGLLALLVLGRGRPVGMTELIDWLWGEDAVPSAGNQLQRLVGQLRRRFEPELEARGAGRVILPINDGYRLADGVRSDLFDVDEQLAHPSASTSVQVLRVIRRPPFAGLERVLGNHPSYVAVERQCAGIALDALYSPSPGPVDRDVVDLVQGVAHRFPYEERLQAALVRALGELGRRADALAHYDNVRTALRDELGIDPGPDLKTAHAELLTLDHHDGAPAHAAEPAATPAQLPRVVGGLVNRPAAQQLLDRVAAQGEAGAVLVTAIGGMGGIGKTTLAVAWAHQLAPRFPDGQLYLNLRGFDASGEVMTIDAAIDALLTTLGGPPADAGAGRPARAALLRSRLAGKRVLLLLDNALDADQVRPLLPGDPGCLAIVTSRNRLSSLVTREGAVPITLDRMSSDEAEELLARRLGQPAVRADPTATRAVLRACDGLPLALALVATRVALEPRLTLGDIAHDLEQVDLASWSAEVGPDDLRAVFAWSFAALDPATIEAFQLIGAHPATRMSTAQLASLLGRDRASCALTLRALCDASLLHQLDRNHYALHDLLRTYARAMPDPDARVLAAERRLVEHFVHTARNAAMTHGLTHFRPADPVPSGVTPESFAGATAAREWCADEHEALNVTIALALRRGWHRQAANVVMDLPNAAQSDGTPTLRTRRLWEILVAAGGHESDTAFDDTALLADVLRVIAFNQKWFGTIEAAEDHLQRAQRLLVARGDRMGQAQVLRGIGRLQYNREQYASALESFYQALDLADGDDAAPVRTRIYINIAGSHFQLGDLGQALEANELAIDTEHGQRSDGSMLIIANINRAEVLLDLGRPLEALLSLEAGRAAGAETSTHWAGLLALRATAALRAGDPTLARRTVEEFRQHLLDHRDDDLGATWHGGLEELESQVDVVERALTATSG